MGVDMNFVEAKPVDVHEKSSLEDWISNYARREIDYGQQRVDEKVGEYSAN